MKKIITSQVLNEDGVVAFFNSLNCPLITATKDGASSVVNIADIFELKDMTVGNGLKVYKHGTQQAIDVSRGYNTPFVTVIYSDNFVYIWGRSSNTSWLTAFSIMVCMSGEKTLAGCYGSSGYSGNVVNMPLFDEDSGLEYHILTVFKEYTPNIDCLDYTVAHLFQGTIKQPDEIDGIFDTSTITQNTVVTFDSRNFYALGPHCLVELES